MAEGHRAVGQALRASGAHVVGAQVLSHGLAGQANDVGQGERAEHHGRHEEGLHGGVRSDGDRQDTPLDAHEVLEDEADDEGRHCDDEQGDDQHGGIEEATAAHAGEDAEEDAEYGFKDDGHDGELHRDREGVGHHLGYGDAGEGRAEVQHEDALDVEQILNDERLV